MTNIIEDNPNYSGAIRRIRFDGLQYKKLDYDRKVPIPIDIIRRYIDAHDTCTDAEIEMIAHSACQRTEEHTERSIFWTEWELQHLRGDILLKSPPIRSISKVSIKVGRKWVDVSLDDEDEFEQSWQNNESRYIKVKKWQEGQLVKVLYFSGYKTDDYLSGNMPSSIYKYILNLCVSEYMRQPMNKESRLEQSDLISSFKERSLWFA